MTLWAEQYIGLPYLDRGMTRDGIGCWGLVRMVLAERAGVDVPPYGELSGRVLGQIARGQLPDNISPQWLAVQPAVARALDVVVMRGAGRFHSGILVSEDRMLHIENHTDSVIVPRDHFSVAGRVVGLFRHKDLTP